MNTYFLEVKKNFGFGMMRLPMVVEEVDIPLTTKMVDAFLAAGFIGWNRHNYKVYPGAYPIRTPSFVAVFEIEYAEGTKETFTTDESWDIYTTETLYCELYDGTIRYKLALPETTTAVVTIPGLLEKTLTGSSHVFYANA